MKVLQFELRTRTSTLSRVVPGHLADGVNDRHGSGVD